MKSLFSFKPAEQESNIVFPKDIVQFQCEELGKLTGQLIVGKIKEYDSPISDYKTQGMSASLAHTLESITQPRDIKIQSKLGEQSNSEFTYEFFITSKYMPNFMYRVFFIRYGISLYPVRLVLDETIAKQIDIDFDIKIETEEEFIEILSMILNCEKFKQVISNLYAINVKLSEKVDEE